mgnify:CR=1 FL=1
MHILKLKRESIGECYEKQSMFFYIYAMSEESAVILKENEIAFAKIRETAIIPTKKLEDAGYDLYANFEEDYFVIEAGKTRAVPTGIATAFSSKYYIQIDKDGLKFEYDRCMN